MAKFPILGKVKTRLAKDLGDDKALEIYIQLLQKTISSVEKFLGEKYIFFDTYPKPLAYIDSEKFCIRQQSDGDLGNRMKQAFIDIQKENSYSIIIGSDCPNLSVTHLEQALESLSQNDYVIGPAIDGGYYLLGLKKITPEIFDLKAWSHDKVMEDTIKIIEQTGSTYLLLEKLKDVDTVEDLFC